MAGQPGIYTVIGDIIIDQACSVLHWQSCKLITSVQSVTAASLQQQCDQTAPGWPSIERSLVLRRVRQPARITVEHTVMMFLTISACERLKLEGETENNAV